MFYLFIYLTSIYNLLAEVGHSLYQLGIPTLKWQVALIHYLRWHSIIYRSKEGLRYLRIITFRNSMTGLNSSPNVSSFTFFLDVGLPLSQAVWMLENLVVFSLAGYLT